MAPVKPMIGSRYGRLIAVSEVGLGSKGMIFTFKCDCGNYKNISGAQVRSGKASSCGCLRSEMMSAKNTKHGHVGSPAYETWQGMKNRCCNEKQPAYKNYGGRGITICDKWQKFEGFLEDMGERPDGCTLERLDNDKGYEKSNCVWATIEQQSRNTRQNKFITHNGKTLCMKDWAKETGIPYPTIQDRRRKGLPPSEILTR